MKPIDSAESTGTIRLIRTFTNIVSPPVIFAVLGFLFAWTQVPFLEGLLWGVLYGVLISLVPIIYVVWLLRTGQIQDINMTRQQRRVPYLVGTLCAVAAALAIYFGGGPSNLFHLALLNIIAIGAMGLINLFWQISNHSTSAVGAAVVCGAVFGQLVGWLLVPLVLAVCAARLYLKRHTPSQLVAGAILGAASAGGLLLAGYFS